MTKEEMLSAIYDEMADKTLNEGCIVSIHRKVKYKRQIIAPLEYRVCVFDGTLTKCSATGGMEMSHDDYQIIGHPVRIGDVIEYVRLKNIWNINPITDEWDYPRLSIEEQSDECIDYVYSLISK